MTEWKCGRYTVRQAIRPDNAAFPCYMIFRGDKLVGRSFSVPDRDWCEAIERLAKWGSYVEHSAAPKSYSYRLKDKARASAAKATRSRQVSKLLGP
jgi:hypothetical protein